MNLVHKELDVLNDLLHHLLREAVGLLGLGRGAGLILRARSAHKLCELEAALLSNERALDFLLCGTLDN